MCDRCSCLEACAETHTTLMMVVGQGNACKLKATHLMLTYRVSSLLHRYLTHHTM